MDIRVYCAYDEMVDIDKLVPNPRNPNKHSQKQIDLLAKIIKHQGWRVPITVSKRSGFVVRGHGRLMAAQKLGLEKVPVDFQDYANEAEEWADLIADNKIQELSVLDDEVVRELLLELDSLEADLELTAYTEKEIYNLLAESPDLVHEDPFDVGGAVAAIEEPATKTGDIWVLGRHRLLCGDSTKADDVAKLFDGKVADMIFTDPPYNVDYVGKTKDALKIKNDKMDGDSFYRFLYDSFVTMFSYLKAGGPIYVCHADLEGLTFRQAFKDAGFLLKQCLIWVKDVLVMGRQDYHWRHEPILYGWKPGAAHAWYGGRKKDTVIEEVPELAIERQGDHFLLTINVGIQTVVLKVPEYELIHAGDDGDETVWRIERPKRNADHPTMKPVRLCARAIQNSSKKGEIVFDPFAGSGSTLIAAEQTGRTCYAIELDPVYCDVIVKRWEEFTSQRAKRLTGEAVEV